MSAATAAPAFQPAAVSERSISGAIAIAIHIDLGLADGLLDDLVALGDFLADDNSSVMTASLPTTASSERVFTSMSRSWKRASASASATTLSTGRRSTDRRSSRRRTRSSTGTS